MLAAAEPEQGPASDQPAPLDGPEQDPEAKRLADVDAPPDHGLEHLPSAVGVHSGITGGLAASIQIPAPVLPVVPQRRLPGPPRPNAELPTPVVEPPRPTGPPCLT